MLFDIICAFVYRLDNFVRSFIMIIGWPPAFAFVVALRCLLEGQGYAQYFLEFFRHSKACNVFLLIAFCLVQHEKAATFLHILKSFFFRPTLV